jgi:uncharacterized protein (DUF1015 family)
MFKDKKVVATIYSTTDVSLFYKNKDNRILRESDVKQIQNFIEIGHGIFPLVVNFDGERYMILDGHHRFEAIKRINKKLNTKLEIPFYEDWKERWNVK